MNKTLYKRYTLELVEENKDTYTSIQIKDKKVASILVATEINKIFKLNRKPEEFLILLCLNSKNYINGVFEISHGDIDNVTTSISNILKRALLVNSNKIIICHNHPSGDISPSKADYNFTDRLFDAADLIGIHLLDHIIIGDSKFESIFNK